MHVFQAILSRRCVRAYLPHPLEREKLEQILHAIAAYTQKPVLQNTAADDTGNGKQHSPCP